MSFLDGIRKHNPTYSPKIIFDVGANKGNVAELFVETFPAAKVYAFEPAQSTFDMLSRRFEGQERVSLHNLALDSAAGETAFMNVSGATGNMIVEAASDLTNTNTVTVTTGDEFCRSSGIEMIDYLKIDTEGYDLRVLVGFAEMLRCKKITYLQVECATNLDNRFHVHLERFIHFLHPFNYRLFRLCDYNRMIYRTKQRLHGIWYCNAVFVLEVDKPALRTSRIN